MARYPQGQPVRVSTAVRDVTGTLVNAGSLTLLVKLAQADGTWATTGTYASPANDSTGGVAVMCAYRVSYSAPWG